MTDQVAEVAGIRVPLGPHLSEMMRAKLVRGKYESREIRLVRSKLRPTDVVLELGAGLGVVSAICAGIVGSQNVFAVEANPSLEQPIRRLYAENLVSPHLEIGVLARDSGIAILHVAEDFWVSSTVAATVGAQDVQVPARAYVDVHRAVRPSFLIVDIEGAEVELARHMVLDGVRTIVIELHPQLIGEAGCEQVIGQLGRSGFRVNKVLSRKHVILLHQRWSRDHVGAQLAKSVACVKSFLPSSARLRSAAASAPSGGRKRRSAG